MKKVIVLVGLVSAFNIKAETYQRAPILEIIPIDNMYASFEILTPKYDKVILDCQSFINGMTFYNDKKIVHEIKMVNYSDCSNVYNFIYQSKQEKKSICMEIEEESNTLNLSNDEAPACQ
jgi:hypothetical protein